MSHKSFNGGKFSTAGNWFEKRVGNVGKCQRYQNLQAKLNFYKKKWLPGPDSNRRPVD